MYAYINNNERMELNDLFTTLHGKKELWTQIEDSFHNLTLKVISFFKNI